MMARTQIMLDRETLRRARTKAGQLGISLAEYIRRLVTLDLATAQPAVDRAVVFHLGTSGGSDVAREKDEMLGAALAASRKRARR